MYVRIQTGTCILRHCALRAGGVCVLQRSSSFRSESLPEACPRDASCPSPREPCCAVGSSWCGRVWSPGRHPAVPPPSGASLRCLPSEHVEEFSIASDKPKNVHGPSVL